MVDEGRRDKAIVHKLCVLASLLDVLVKGVKLVKILLNLVSSHGWLSVWDKPWEMTCGNGFRLLGGISFKEDSSRVGVVWMEVDGGIVRARVVSRVVLGLVMKVVLVVLRGSEVFVRWFWMGELSLEEVSMKSLRGIFFRGFWVEELALEAMEYDDQDEEDYLQIFSV
ncbi:hypothetical protein Tco_0499256 [Tanacetum coccineum]